MLTARDLLQGTGVRVLSGETRLDEAVRWVHVSELLDPTPLLSGGELLLTTGMQLDTEPRQREFVGRLSERDLAGLGLGTGFSHGDVPPALLEAAAERSFLLFEVPHVVRFTTICESATARLVNDQYDVLNHALETQDKLERIVLSEDGMEGLVRALATLLAGNVMVLGRHGQELLHRSFGAPANPAVVAALRFDIRKRPYGEQARPLTLNYDRYGLRAVAMPIRARAALANGAAGHAIGAAAWLVCVKPASAFSERDLVTLQRAVTVVALEVRRALLAEETQRRAARHIVMRILDGGLAGDEVAQTLQSFGLHEKVATIVVHPPEARGGRGMADVETAVGVALRREAAPGLVASTDAFVCALVGALPNQQLFELAGRVRIAVAAELRSAVRVGVGRAVDLADARLSVYEAESAIKAVSAASSRFEGGLGTRATPVDRVATYKDLGSIQLLLSMQSDEELDAFCEAILGAVEAADGRYGGELMRSLRIFIEENGQWERASRRLFCHRHTLRYRIRKIEELTERDLERAEDRIEFWLALRGRELSSRADELSRQSRVAD
jgi:purine catabolism regulator